MQAARPASCRSKSRRRASSRSTTRLPPARTSSCSTTSRPRRSARRCAGSRGRAKVEISGGVTLERIPELAATGADYVSVGALTHSAPAVGPELRARTGCLTRCRRELAVGAATRTADRRGSLRLSASTTSTKPAPPTTWRRRWPSAARRKARPLSPRRRRPAAAGSAARWLSPPDAGLYASLIVRDARAAPLLTLAGGVAVAEGDPRATGLPVEIKWPNDIVVDAGLGRAPQAGRHPGRSVERGRRAAIRGARLRHQYPAASRLSPRHLTGAPSSIAELGRPVAAGRLLAECLASLADVVSGCSPRATAVGARPMAELAPSSHGARVEWERRGRSSQRGRPTGCRYDGALLVRRGSELDRVVSGGVHWG